MLQMPVRTPINKIQRCQNKIAQHTGQTLHYCHDGYTYRIAVNYLFDFFDPMLTLLCF